MKYSTTLLQTQIMSLRCMGFVHVTGMRFICRASGNEVMAFPQSWWSTHTSDGRGSTIVIAENGEVWFRYHPRSELEKIPTSCVSRQFDFWILHQSVNGIFFSTGNFFGLTTVQRFLERVADPYCDFDGAISPDPLCHLESVERWYEKMGIEQPVFV